MLSILYGVHEAMNSYEKAILEQEVMRLKFELRKQTARAEYYEQLYLKEKNKRSYKYC